MMFLESNCSIFHNVDINSELVADYEIKLELQQIKQISNYLILRCAPQSKMLNTNNMIL